MEYELKKSQILSQVQYTNLLSFSLVQNKLQKNFRHIVDVLILNQTKIDQLINNQIEAKEYDSKQISKLHGLVRQVNQRLQSLQNKQKHTYSNVSSTPSQKQDGIKKVEKQQEQFRVQSADYNYIAEGLKLKINDWQTKWNDDKQEIMRKINSINENLNGVGFFENEIKILKDQFKTIKDDLLFSLKKDNFVSIRPPIKPSSIQNSLNKPFQDLIKQQTRNSIQILAKEEDKENNLRSFLKNQTQVNNQNLLNETVQKQINSLYLELNMIKISFEELKDLISDNRKQIFKNISSLSEFKEDFVREVKTRKGQDEDIHKNIKEIKMQLLNNINNMSSQNVTQIESDDIFINELGKVVKGTKKKDDEVNYKNQMNDKISRLQAMVKNLITQSQFYRFKNDVKDQLERLQREHKSYETDLQNGEKKLLDLVLQSQSNNHSQFEDLKNRMVIFQDNSQFQENQNQRKHNILNAKIQEVKEQTQNLKKDLQLYQSIMTQNNQSTQKQHELQEIINTNQDDNNKNHEEAHQKRVETLKKYFNGKIQDMRMNLLGLIRDLQKKLSNRPIENQQFIKIWDKLNEFKLFLNKKADQDDSKKTFLYLEKQINRIGNILSQNSQNTQDARLARSNKWNCLSCDKNLITYQGKIGKHVSWDSMPLKAINKTISTQQQDKKKGFPQLKK